MEYRHILFDVSEEIATVTLNRPEARNALTPEMREDLTHALGEIRKRAGKDIKAMILTGAGRAFCAGGDVKAMGTRSNRAPDQRAMMRAFHNTLFELTNAELPVISLIDGAAAGAGANIALTADFVLATPRGFLMQAFARIGLIPDWGGFYILPRLVGMQKARELIFTARRVYAEEAKQIGLIYDVVGQETAMAEARAFAKKLAKAPTAAIGVAKNILNQSYNQDIRTLSELEAMGQSICRDTDFHKEAVRRFAAKEPPLYDWEAMQDAGDD
ncbi:MAG: enoyl-CoA hydratase/isomerase family protein [Proteobacteria bacterium]|nr:enoyl-CoA hydratase/isomerase family protein [Pseudomonadota bacterium]